MQVLGLEIKQMKTLLMCLLFHFSLSLSLSLLFFQFYDFLREREASNANEYNIVYLFQY